VGKPEGKRPLRRHRNRRENNITSDLKEIEWEGMDWINLAQDRNMIMHLDCKKCGKLLD
jgi:hypothetical protein